MRDLPGADGLRGLSALLVVLLHAALAARWQEVPIPSGAQVLGWGWVGVDFFFVLSAFLLARALLSRDDGARRPGFWRTYLARRWWRIAPPYYAGILLAVWFIAPPTAPAWRDVALHLTYLHSWRPETLGSMNAAFWTLAIEFQFYVLLPIMLYAFKGDRWKLALPAALAISLAWRSATFEPERLSWLSYQVPGFLFHFALGITLARLYGRMRVPGAAAILAVVGMIALLAWADLPMDSQGERGYWTNLFLRAPIALAFAVLIGFATQPGAAPGLLSGGPMRRLGETSYSLYLIHAPVMFAVTPWLVRHGFDSLWEVVVALTTLSLVAGWLYFYSVERTALRWRDRAARPRGWTLPAPAAAPASDTSADGARTTP